MISAISFQEASIIYILNDNSGPRQPWRTKIYGYLREPIYLETSFNVIFQPAIFFAFLKKNKKHQ